MNLSNKIFFLYLMNLLFCVASTAGGLQTKQDLQNTIDSVIAECQEKIAIVKEQKIKIKNYRKYSIEEQSSRKDFKLNQKIYRLAFMTNLAELEKYASKTDGLTVDMKPSKLSDALKAYSVNCTLFTQGIFDFVEYLMAGKPPVTQMANALVFEEWIFAAAMEYYRKL